MKLSIIIVNYKSFPEVKECVNALMEHAPDFPFEIIVVDNDSAQPEAEKNFLQEFGKRVAFVKNERNVGFGGGADSGFQKAKGEYFLLLNPDVGVWEGALNEAVRFLDEHPETGILGAQLRYHNGMIQDSYRNFPKIFDQCIKRVSFLRRHRSLRKRVSHYLMWDKDPEKTEAVDWVVGGCLFIRRKAYEEIGGFDQRYFLFMEDVDICRQMWKHGYHVMYHPKVKATHGSQRLSSGGVLALFTKKTLRIHLASAIKYFWKYKFESLPRRENK